MQAAAAAAATSHQLGGDRLRLGLLPLRLLCVALLLPGVDGVQRVAHDGRHEDQAARQVEREVVAARRVLESTCRQSLHEITECQEDREVLGNDVGLDDLLSCHYDVSFEPPCSALDYYSHQNNPTT